jgi:hypothetical protein
MGKGSAEIEQEIRAKRKAISAKVDEMTQRGADDVREAADRVQELFDSTPITKTADEHPFLTLAGALGVGVVLGMASESVSLGSLFGGSGSQAGPPRYDQWRQQNESQRTGLLSGLIVGLESAAIEEGRQLFHEWMAPTRNGRDGSGNGHTQP